MRTIFSQILILIILLCGQRGLTQQILPADSLPSSNAQLQPDSAKTRRLTNRSILDQWPAEATFKTISTDSLLEPTFRFKDLIYLNYNGLADVFRLRPDVQIFDFLEMGLPRFVSELHLWPQQTRFVFDDFSVNDPTNGMFDTRFLYPDPLHLVALFGQNESTLHTDIPQKAGTIGFYSRLLNPQEPYTRIMYREGDFGYTDLDITFAERIGAKTLLHLGGINRDYSPNNYRGTHYRGGLIRQLTPHLLGTFRYQKSSENVSFFDVYGSEFGLFRYNEVWEMFRAKLLHVTDALKNDWQIRALFNNSRRKYRFSEADLRSRLRFDRFIVQAVKNWDWKRVAFRTLGEVLQDKTWGSVYHRKYTDSRFKIQTVGAFRLPDSLQMIFNTALRYQWGQPLQLEPEIDLLWQKSLLAFHLNASRYARFPSAHERFFDFEGISGQRVLRPESHQVLHAGVDLAPVRWNQTKISFIYHAIANEILFNGKTFFNGDDRHFAFGMVQSAVRWYKFGFRFGAQMGMAGSLLGPQYSGFAQMRYHDRWIHGHMIVDATGKVQWYGPGKNIAYQPYAERFYRASGQSDGFYLLSYKIVATVKDAHLFMEMDNPLGLRYQIIKGYPEWYRRVRFGVSWVLWN